MEPWAVLTRKNQAKCLHTIKFQGTKVGSWAIWPYKNRAKMKNSLLALSTKSLYVRVFGCYPGARVIPRESQKSRKV